MQYLECRYMMRTKEEQLYSVTIQITDMLCDSVGLTSGIKMFNV